MNEEDRNFLIGMGICTAVIAGSAVAVVLSHRKQMKLEQQLASQISQQRYLIDAVNSHIREGNLAIEHGNELLKKMFQNEVVDPTVSFIIHEIDEGQNERWGFM